MAYVTARKGGRFEIRESTSTPRGPRSRTLASFRVLDDDVLAHALDRASRQLDLDAIRARARALGAVISEASPVDETARDLVALLRDGRRPSPLLQAILRQLLGDGPAEASRAIRDTVTDAAQWHRASDARRGRALVDLLGLGDALPHPQTRGPLTFPRIASG